MNGVFIYSSGCVVEFWSSSCFNCFYNDAFSAQSNVSKSGCFEELCANRINFMCTAKEISALVIIVKLHAENSKHCEQEKAIFKDNEEKSSKSRWRATEVV